MRAPGDDAAWDAPWTVEFASPLPGLAERFQLRNVPKPSAQDDVVKAQDDPWSGMTTETKAWAPSFRMLYSELMRGFIQCNGGGVSNRCAAFRGKRRTSRASSSSSILQERMLRRWPRPGSYSRLQNMPRS